MRHGGRALALLVAGIVVLAACGGDDGDSGASSRSSDDTAGEVAQVAGGTGAAGGQATTGQATSATPLTAPRDVVYTATLQLTVDDPDAAIDSATARVTTAGGYLFSRQSSATDASRRAVVVFKVPPDVFLATLDALADLGDEQGRRVQADDVSAQVVDLESRLKTAQASVDRTRELLARATSINDIVTIERELASRETTLEQIQGQLRVVRGQIGAGTITVELATSPAALSRLADDDDGIPTPMDGLRAGGRALAGTARVVALVVAALLPWLPVILVVAWLARFVQRRRVARRPSFPPAPWSVTERPGARAPGPPPAAAAGATMTSSGLPPPGPPPGSSTGAEPAVDVAAEAPTEGAGAAAGDPDATSGSDDQPDRSS